MRRDQRVHRHGIHYFQNTVSKSLTVKYDVRQLATQTLTLKYDIWYAVVTKTLTLLYALGVRGVILHGPFAKPALVGSRIGRYEDVEYTTWIQGGLLVPTILTQRIKVPLLTKVSSTGRIVSNLLKRVESTLKLKSLLETTTESTYKIKSPLLVEANGYNTKFVAKNTNVREVDKKKLKKVLLINLLGDVNNE